jgi:hypothetical protein
MVDGARGRKLESSNDAATYGVTKPKEKFAIE